MSRSCRRFRPRPPRRVDFSVGKPPAGGGFLFLVNVEGISSRVPTERLRTLEGAGFVFRNYQPTIPPAVTYGIIDRMRISRRFFTSWRT